ncbi:DUF6896 domain-containing protein [Sorangium sp. So ce887]|uniref:DUF6896 domain-containing protein n=1 Tax=Sorangium sp. So ce887 TaxID=3133324 RepID=UPI003F6466CE
MDPRLAKLIEDYRAKVAEAVALLERAGIPRPSSSLEWSQTDVAGRGEFTGGYRYFKHGFGCAVAGPKWTVDFDFGDEGQIDGFDAWRLLQFAGKRLGQYGFTSQEQLEHTFEDAKAAGDLVYSGYILYYTK